MAQGDKVVWEAAAVAAASMLSRDTKTTVSYSIHDTTIHLKKPVEMTRHNAHMGSPTLAWTKEAWLKRFPTSYQAWGKVRDK